MAGLLLQLCGCAPLNPVVQENTPAVSSDAAEVETIPTADTRTAEPIASITDGLVNPSDTATPYVWIDNNTVVPDAATAPVFPTFTVTSTPTITLTPTKGPSARFTRTPTSTATITATSLPPSGAMIIRQPGPASRITSPFEIVAAITRGEDKLVYLYLIGEDGQDFYSEVLDYRQSDYNRLLITPSIQFDISNVAKNARVILQAYDLQGRLMSLASVDVILLSIGRNETHPAERSYTPFVIDSPDDGDEINGSRLVVSGRAAPLNKNPVIIELLDNNGKVLAKRELDLDEPLTGETYTHFAVELDYSAVQQIAARLVVRQESDNRIPGTIALSSVAVTLLP